MVDKKITELAGVTGGNLADDDVFVVVDISEDETKKVTREEFFKDTPNITVTSSGGYATFKSPTFGGAGIQASNGNDTLTFIDFNAPDISSSGGAVDYRFGRSTTEGDTSNLTFYAHDGTNNPVFNVSSAGDVKAAGALELKGNALNGVQITIADDTVAEFTFSGRSGGFLFVGAQFDTAFPQTQFSYGGVVDFGDSPSRLTAFQQGANVEVNTVDTLTGTTGTDGDLTIGLAGTSGSLYLENRAGLSRTFQITLL